MTEQRWAKRIHDLEDLLAEKYQTVAHLIKLDLRIEKLLKQIVSSQLIFPIKS